MSDPGDGPSGAALETAAPRVEGAVPGVPVYRRVLLKLSGEAFVQRDQGFGISSEATKLVAGQ